MISICCHGVSFEIQVNVNENIILGNASIASTIGLIIQCFNNDNCSLKTNLNACCFALTRTRVKSIRIKIIAIKLIINGQI